MQIVVLDNLFAVFLPEIFFANCCYWQLFAKSGPRTQALIAEEDLYSNCSHSSYTSVWSLFNRLCLVLFNALCLQKEKLMIFLIKLMIFLIIDSKNDVLLTQQNWATMWNYGFEMINGLATIRHSVPKKKKIFFLILTFPWFYTNPQDFDKFNSGRKTNFRSGWNLARLLRSNIPGRLAFENQLIQGVFLLVRPKND